MTQKRKLDNWLLAFRDWALPRTEAPENFIFWAGLFTLSAAIRKHVMIPKKFLGGWECYPNIFIVFVGPPGIAKKTTSMNFGDELLSQLPEIPASPTIITQAALMSALSESNDGSLYITSGELSSLISKSKTEMFEFLTDGYDTRKPIIARTIKRGTEIVQTPCINMLACTTPSWIHDNMPAAVIGGGFAARCIFIYEDGPSAFRMYYTNIDQKKVDIKSDELVHDLIHISSLSGEFEIAKEALDFVETWYHKNMNSVSEKDPRLRGYFARKHVHVHKIAQLIKLAKSDELILNVEDFEQAFSVLSMVEKRMLGVFKSVGQNQYTVETDDIREFIKINKKVGRGLIYRSFQASAQPEYLERILQSLVIMGDVNSKLEGDEIYYTLNTAAYLESTL